MTESEARSKIKYRIEVAREIAGNGVDGKAFEDLEIAIQALKEIREYRAIGTVEEFKALKEKNGWHDMEMYGLGYNQGTIDRADELQKCREQGYKKAIDEFAERIKQGDVIEYMGSYVSYEAIESFIDEIAERMKGGATDERTGIN